MPPPADRGQGQVEAAPVQPLTAAAVPAPRRAPTSRRGTPAEDRCPFMGPAEGGVGRGTDSAGLRPADRNPPGRPVQALGTVRRTPFS